VEFHNGGWTLDSSSTVLTKQIGSNCGDPDKPCFEYMIIQTSDFLFHSDSVPIIFKVSRTKNINNIHLSVIPPVVNDLLTVSINDYLFVVNLNQDTIYQNYNYGRRSTTDFIDSLNIAGKFYYSVYHSYYDSSSGAYPELPAGIYYNKQYGLLRFDFSNNEIWELQ
jgi:hypothetical protein